MNPLVSCIMPTWNRRPFIRAAIQSFLDQTYENRELVIVDDGNDLVGDLIPEDARVRYIQKLKKVSTGAKRNLCCEAAAGEIICHFDDDDFSLTTRIADQIARLSWAATPITGYGTMLFWDETTQEAKRYRTSVKGYVCGTSLCYYKDWWRMRPFENLQVASDNAFVNPVLRQIASADGSAQMVARIHNHHHTSPKDGIAEVVPKELIPAEFWANESLIQWP